MNENVSYIVKNGLCTSCGICVGICHKKCISMNYGEYNNYPSINNNKCLNCGLCLKVCPGKGATLRQSGADLFPSSNINPLCGRYLKSYVGYSTDAGIRYHSASGGVVSQFLIYLLQNKFIDGAVVVRYKEDNPFEPEPFIATSKDEILASKSSKYVIVSYDKVIDDIKNFDGKLAVVGLPCQIQGLRNAAKYSKIVRDRIVGYFGIYCSLNKTKSSIDYYSYRYKVNKKDVKSFSFRDDGCMGAMKFIGKNNKVLAKIPYLTYWNNTKSFFMNDRCSLCNDHFAELSDISFGDIHIEPYSQDKIGISSLIVRKEQMAKLLDSCRKEGFLHLESIDIETLTSSQIYSKIYKKGAGLQAEFKIRKLFNKPNPVYDDIEPVQLQASNFIKNISRWAMRSIGKRRFFWPLIVKLEKL